MDIYIYIYILHKSRLCKGAAIVSHEAAQAALGDRAPTVTRSGLRLRLAEGGTIFSLPSCDPDATPRQDLKWV